jgi:CYTH domain-containing protein
MGRPDGPGGADLHKKRHVVQRGGVLVAIDEHQDGTLVAETDDGDQPPQDAPDWLDILEDVSNEERWTGAYLAVTPSGR